MITSPTNDERRTQAGGGGGRMVGERSERRETRGGEGFGFFGALVRYWLP